MKTFKIILAIAMMTLFAASLVKLFDKNNSEETINFLVVTMLLSGIFSALLMKNLGK